MLNYCVFIDEAGRSDSHVLGDSDPIPEKRTGLILIFNMRFLRLILISMLMQYNMLTI